MYIYTRVFLVIVVLSVLRGVIPFLVYSEASATTDKGVIPRKTYQIGTINNGIEETKVAEASISMNSNASRTEIALLLLQLPS